MNGLNRIDWIQKIHPNFKEEKWFNDNVIRPNEIEHFEFYEESSTYKDYINPNFQLFNFLSLLRAVSL